ncbi:DNA repair protein RecO [Mycoplasmopsis primatum]|uniref:DNA repair protein RecO n=1 Tax=Mycoplasmopsis primatum TaxID=55604 RepID=UPI000495BE72|nr:recombination protein O N-terminal domain-containing protein [Mycoplasmopsis primatum]
MSEKIEKMIILKIEEYLQEPNAAIVTALSERGLVTLFASGILKSQSKNRANLQIGSICEVEYFQARINKKMNRLKKATNIISLNYHDDFSIKFVIKMGLFLENFTHRCTEIFEAYEYSLNLYNRQFKESFDAQNSYVLLAYLTTYIVSKSLKYNGIQPNTDTCINCKSPSNLCDFNFKEGGFLCGNCSNKQRWTKELKCFYYLFKNFKTYASICTYEVNKIIYNEMINHLIRNGIYINWEKLKKA